MTIATQLDVCSFTNTAIPTNNGIHTVKHWMERKLPTDLVPRSLCRLMEAYWQLELSNMAPVSIFQHNAGTEIWGPFGQELTEEAGGSRFGSSRTISDLALSQCFVRQIFAEG